MTPLPHHLDRALLIRAPRSVVFSFFTDSARWASWWGAGSTIDASVGGRVHIRHPNGIEGGGEVLELAAPDRIVFSYGFASGTPMPIGASRVTMTFDEEEGATRVRLHHAFDDAPARDAHIQGWRYQLSLFANAVAALVHADAATKVDTWFKAWTEPDAQVREQMLNSVAVADVQFRDQYSCVEGMSELLPHIAATQYFMPGISLRREGVVRQCQGVVLADWAMVGPDGQTRGQGSNVFMMGPDGRIETATGLFGATANPK